MVELHFTRDDGAAADVTLHDPTRAAEARHTKFHVLVTQREQTLRATSIDAL